MARCGAPPRWLFVELVPVDELAAWEADKHAGAGRDRRLGGPSSGRSGGTLLGLDEAIASGILPGGGTGLTPVRVRWRSCFEVYRYWG